MIKQGYSSFYSSSIFKQVLAILLIIIAGAIVTYWIDDKLIKTAYYIVLLLLFYFSRKNSFWLALFFILTSAPFGLFFALDSVVIYLTDRAGFRLPMFVAIICVVKYLNIKLKTPNYAQYYYKAYGYYFILLLIISIVYEITFYSAYYIISGVPTLAFFFAIPLMLNSEEKFIYFNRIVFVFSIIFTIHVFADIALSGKITNILAPGGTDSAIPVIGRLVRQMGGIMVSLYSLILSLYYLASRSKKFNSLYLSLVAIISMFFIINSATRGYIIAGIFSIIAFLFIEKSSILKYSLVALLISGFIILIVPQKVKVNLSLAYERLLTLKQVVEGDVTAGGTSIRLDKRAPRVLTHFHKNPVTGFGLSKITDEYGDEHVGNHNLLLRSGIVGFAIVYYTIIFLSVWVLEARSILKNVNPSAKGLYVIVIGFAAVVIIHSTCRDMINYPVPWDAAFLLSLFIALVNAVILDSQRIAKIGLIK